MEDRPDTLRTEDAWNRREEKPAKNPAERKQRRLESNRAAAKRAYYRRQDKVQNLQLENEQLRADSVEHRFKISIYESLLRRLGVDPDVAVEAIRGSAKPVLVPAQQPKADVGKQLRQQPQNSDPSELGPDQLHTMPQAHEPVLQPLAVVQPLTSDAVQSVVEPGTYRGT